MINIITHILDELLSNYIKEKPLYNEPNKNTIKKLLELVDRKIDFKSPTKHHANLAESLKANGYSDAESVGKIDLTSNHYFEIIKASSLGTVAFECDSYNHYEKSHNTIATKAYDITTETVCKPAYIVESHFKKIADIKEASFWHERGSYVDYSYDYISL
jgi:hypothetical protein